MRPCSARICPTARAAESSSVTSSSRVFTPAAASSVIRCTRRAAPYTTKPAARRWRAVVSPMPDEAPVTRATFWVMARLLAQLGRVEEKRVVLAGGPGVVLDRPDPRHDLLRDHVA